MSVITTTVADSRISLPSFVSKWKASIILILALSTGGVGCSRTHYRLQADNVVSDAVAGATANPRFQLPGHSIAVDPRSRLFDPTDADRPPMPPDDPDSHRLMECVDGHRGWRHWEKDGVLNDVEVNDYRSWLPYDSDGKIRVDLPEAVSLARLHSREYQSQLETLYLSALDVTAERFAFQCQFFGGNTTQYTAISPLFNGGSGVNLLNNNTNLFINRTFTTGGTLVTGIANSIIWNFNGNRSSVNTSLLNFSLSQPLLQFAGKPRVMEKLTRVERNLLSNVRMLERYRQGFYLSVAVGVPNNSSLSRAGGLFGGSGLVNFSGVGVGGFGNVGVVNGLSAANIAGGAVAPSGLGGYLGFLQQKQIIRNQRAQNARLRDAWLQLTAAFDAGRLENRFQVDFARQAYYSSQSQLLTNLAAYESTLDGYKTAQMGLPPDLPLEINGNFFDQFNMIDPDLTGLQNEIEDRLESLMSAQFVGSQLEEATLVHRLSERIREFADAVTIDLKTMQEGLPDRRRALEALAEFPELKDSQFDIRALTPEALTERITSLQADHLRIDQEINELVARVDEFSHQPKQDSEEFRQAEKEILSRLSGALLELSLLQARARLHTIAIIPIKVTPEAAFQVALSQRPDWMNAKASLVDSWRLIRYNANALRSNVTVNVSGQVGNISASGATTVVNSGTDGTLQAGLTIDPPLTRVIERNVFRQSLIDYQQARRSVMQGRDDLHRGLRGRLRLIRLNQFNLELRRLAVDVAITQTDVARLRLVEPEKPQADGKMTTTTSPTVARDLVDAVQNLLNNQQFFINTWGDYEQQRRLLDYDMGTMRLDENGMWIDPGPVTDESIAQHYYEVCPNPLDPSTGTTAPGYIELLPQDLPPEPSTLDLPESDSTPSSQ